jgi:hypothetical protein
MENSIEVSQKLKRELPYDLAISFVDILPEEMKPVWQSDSWNSMFIIAHSQNYGKNKSAYPEMNGI